MKRFLLSMLIAGSIFFLNLPAYAVYPGERAETGRPEFVPGQILVKFRQDTTPAVIREINEKQKVRIKKVIGGIGVHVLTFSPDIPVEEMVGRYNADVSVEYAEPDYIATAAAIPNIPNDPRFSEQWGLNNTNDADIDAPQGWGINTGITAEPPVKIAIVDTGISSTHEDLKDKIVPGWNTIKDNSNANDDNGHGSHVAGIASARTDNGKGIAGVCWGCALMPVKVLNAAGLGTYSDVAEGITWAANNGAKVINLSLGGPSYSDTLKIAVNNAWTAGALLACAAGNSGDTTALYPANYDNCIAVAATDSNDKKAYFSTYGSWVDVAAPGVNILSAYKGKSSTYKYLSGTSMATPHVSGLAGLLFSASVPDSNGDKKINNVDIRAQIEKTCDTIPDTGTYWANGRINACKALGGTTEDCDTTVAAQNGANGATVGKK